jgi:hypothetical protein
MTSRRTSPQAAERRRQSIEAVLAELEELGEKLLAARSPKRLKAIHDRAELLRMRLRTLGRGTAARRGRQKAAEVKVRAERKLGAWLRDNLPRGGDHRSAQRTGSALRRLGIERHQSSKWQLAAELTESRFEALIKETRERGAELTTSAVLRFVRPPRHTAVARPAARPAGNPREADLVDRLAEIHRHALQVESLIAPAVKGDPATVQPFVWRQVASVIADVGRLSDLDSGT